LVRLDAEERVLLNPQIKERSQELVVESEGCLSLPGVEADVARAQGVMVQAQDEEGHPVELRLDGLQARLLQHEVDHLDGVLFIDHLGASDRRRALREYRAARAAGKGPTSSAL
jgi:peptide deformylase